MTHRFSLNGKPSMQDQSNAAPGEYVKNEVDHKSDRLNDLWMRLEKELLKAQPPRRITCAYFSETHENDEGEFEERRYLGIQRHGGKWRICHAVTSNGAGDENLPWRPIAECDRETRMDATNGIVRLRKAVEQTRTLFIPALDAAIEKLESALFDQSEKE